MPLHGRGSSTSQIKAQAIATLLTDALDAPRPLMCHPFFSNKKAAPEDGLARVAGFYRFLLYQGVLVCAFVLAPALFILPQTPDSLNHFLLIRSEA